MSPRVLPDGRAAPHCWVRFVCPACHGAATLDAYHGPAVHTCTAPAPVMVPERVVTEPDAPQEQR